VRRIYAATVGTKIRGGETTLNHKRPHWRRRRPRGKGFAGAEAPVLGKCWERSAGASRAPREKVAGDAV
jgi:hypothetical protein